MDRQEIDALKEMANSDITKIFDALRMDYDERYQYITSQCPIHNGDRIDAFSWVIDYGTYRCFSRGCEQKYGKDVFGLVMGVLKCKFPRAITFVKKIYANGKRINTDGIEHRKKNRDFINSQKNEEDIIYPDTILNKLEYHDYLESRDYSRDIIEKYQIGMPSNKYGKMSNRIIIPIRNINGEIVGFTGRTIYNDWKERGIFKWQHSKGFKKSRHLFNIDKAAKHIREAGSAIIVEGPLDVLRLEQAGIHNSVAIFGRSMENSQLAILMSCGANILIVALDSDNAGKTGAEEIKNNASAFFNVKIVNLENGDVGELNIEKCKELFEEANI